MAKVKKDGDVLIMKLDNRQYAGFRDLPQEIKCLMAVGYVGGKTKKVHTEDVAIQLWKWLPEDYGFVKYPKKYPDKQMPKRGLTSIRTYEWVAGGMSQKITEDGYKLTPTGIDIYNKVEYLLPEQSGSRVSRKEISFLNNKILNTKIYKNFKIAKERGQDMDINEFELCDLLGSTPGLFQQTRTKFFDYFAMAIKNEKSECVEFFEHIKDKQSSILDDQAYNLELRNRKKL